MKIYHKLQYSLNITKISFNKCKYKIVVILKTRMKKNNK